MTSTKLRQYGATKASARRYCAKGMVVGSVMAAGVRSFIRLDDMMMRTDVFFHRRRQSQDRVSGSGIAHEKISVRGTSALFVQGIARPEALLFILMLLEPINASL